MRLLALLTPVFATASNLPQPQHIFSNPPSSPSTPQSTYKIPTIHESAVQARRILHLESLGTLSTLFPHTSTLEKRPSDVSGLPIGLMDYYADCEPASGNPTILAITIATSFKNVASGSNITLSLRWHPPNWKHYSAAALPRYSLVGYLEDLTAEEVVKEGMATCFVGYHPDAAAWLPGNMIHESKFVRLVVQEVYWIGGFGDRAYIGWIPVEEWRGVKKEEMEGIRLPGEKKARAWDNSWWSWLGLGEERTEGEGWEL
ncbi:hypothetical protein EJ04DRAFT_510168 [Polyplosphaeria fusca]|uniref:CREG-like beta-barrel domain-containing protein n=1 Tax=Polyplosphaeria fusca TaxID=682080 RepID=A0A9P4V6L3_9PLEO|nr:hypothetical protein EJ04DRAFT_510168 [Polyplosphaeria fusca]